MRTILAVAIGDPSKPFTFTKPDDPDLNSVRPYIKGLINWLSKQTPPPSPKKLKKYLIGTDYEIQYRQAQNKHDVADLFKNLASEPDLIFCMSTTVAREAANFTATIPVVAIVSDPKKENRFGTNVCGVSAKRSQHASDCYEYFKEKSGLSKIYYLHKAGYSPSDESKYWLPNDPDTVPVPIGPDADINAIKDAIYNLTPSSGGLLFLPVDQFFGAGPDIVKWATDQKLPTFWSVPDWPPGAYGGYGVPQMICGQYMAERVASIWSSGGLIPEPPFVLIPDAQFTGKINHSVAEALEVGKRKTKRKARKMGQRGKKKKQKAA